MAYIMTIRESKKTESGIDRNYLIPKNGAEENFRPNLSAGSKIK